MSRIFSIFIAALFCTLVPAATHADTFQLTDGTTVSGELIPAAADLNGLQVRVDSSTYQRIPWSKISQGDLKRLKEEYKDNPKLVSFIDPFLEELPPPAQPPIEIKPVARLERPSNMSLLGAMASSSVGLMVLLLLYAANIYAGFEIARFRKRPPGLVCGASAVLPVIGPIIFLSLRTPASEAEYVAPEVVASQEQTFSVTGVPSSAATKEEPTAASSLRISATEGGHAQTGTIPETQTFARGQFMFNRRFFETKFPGFFGIVRRDAERDLVLLFKTSRGEYVGQRIARISSSELHLQVQQGAASTEVMIPFADVKEIQLKHKDA